MSDIPPARPPNQSAPHYDAVGSASDLRSLAIVCYVLFLLASVNGVTAIVGVIIAYVKRHDAAGTIWRSHFANIILTFWVMVIAVILGFLTWPIAIGAVLIAWPVLWPPVLTLPFAWIFLIFPLLALWYLYRIIRGLVRASEERAY